MKITSRRFWPLWLAVVCWILLIVITPTRNQLLSGWTNNYFMGVEEDEEIDVFTPLNRNPNPDANELLKRYPQNVDVELYAAQEKKDAYKRLQRMPQNVPMIVMALQQEMDKLNADRFEGPLSNPNYPKPYAPTPAPVIAPLPPEPPVGAPPPANSPPVPPPTGARIPPPPPTNVPSSEVKIEKSSPAEWNRYIALARRGQSLEPKNAFFDWMLLYGLYASRQDAQARATLAKAAQKTAYDDHSRELCLTRLAILRLASNKPLSPRDQNFVFYPGIFVQYSKFRQTARWIMEGVIADRMNGNHNRALDAAVDLMQISRLVRRESYMLIGSMVGTACEAISMAQVTMPPTTRGATRKPQFGAALGAFQADKRMLYFYANSQKRNDITQLLNKDWVEAGKWRKLNTVIMNQQWTGNTIPQSLAIIVTERFTGLVVKALPSILILCLIFTLLSRRFRDETAARGTVSRGIWFGLGLWVYALACDAICAFSMGEDSGFYTPDEIYTFGGGLLWSLPWWATFGMAGAALCFGLNQTVLWQKEQAGQKIGLKTRLKKASQAPEDGLARFDFGWILGLALHLTIWIILAGGLLYFSYQYSDLQIATGGYIDSGLVLMQGALLVTVLLSLRIWRSLPRRHETFLLSFRLVGGALAGLFVATSVLYTLVALIMLPVSLRFEDNFTKAMQSGEVNVARAKLGL